MFSWIRHRWLLWKTNRARKAHEVAVDEHIRSLEELTGQTLAPRQRRFFRSWYGEHTKTGE